ncbi:MAG: ABC transporter permease [Lachnospiraceae bacterium]|nr:ABC transporter permease [Lachnospiraceae bacterium]
MEQFLAITGRNIKVYLRDRGAVFFSLLSTFIVIGLMVFFLGDMNINGLTGLLENFPGRDAVADKENAELMVLSWTCAGILAINAVTVTLAVFSGMIKDRVSGKLNSIYTAPLSRVTIAAGYIAAAWVCSVIVCVLTLIVTEVYGMLQGMESYSFLTHLQLLGLIMVNSFVFATIMYPIAILAKTEGAWSGLGTIVGTLVGFLGGIYIPIGSLSEGIASAMKCTPIIYSTAMFRSVMNETILEQTFEGVPEEVICEYRQVMGIDLKVFDRLLSVTEEWILLCLCGIMFLIVGALMLKYEKKTDR